MTEWQEGFWPGKGLLGAHVKVPQGDTSARLAVWGLLRPAGSRIGSAARPHLPTAPALSTSSEMSGGKAGCCRGWMWPPNPSLSRETGAQCGTGIASCCRVASGRMRMLPKAVWLLWTWGMGFVRVCTYIQTYIYLYLCVYISTCECLYVFLPPTPPFLASQFSSIFFWAGLEQFRGTRSIIRT